MGTTDSGDETMDDTDDSVHRQTTQAARVSTKSARSQSPQLVALALSKRKGEFVFDVDDC
jgi:hypothetical protein